MHSNKSERGIALKAVGSDFRFSGAFKMLLLASTASIMASSVAVAADIKGATPGTTSPTQSIGGAGNGWGGSSGGGSYTYDGFPTQGVGGAGQNGLGPSGVNAGGAGGNVGATTISSDVNMIEGGAGQLGTHDHSEGGPSSAGGGGGGGAGVYLQGGEHTTVSGQIIVGGAGGAGGHVHATTSSDYTNVMAGSGGGGGAGAIIDRGTLTNAAGARIVGGAGGQGGSDYNNLPSNYWNWGGSGAGGDGVVVQNGSRFENYGVVQGGQGVDASEFANVKSNGGAGIRVGGNGYVVNAGVVSAGASYGQSSATNAIEINGNNTTLELRNGSNIQGNVVVANGMTNNTLALGGTQNSTFAANEIGTKYQGFDGYKKIGTSTWTLTGTNNQLTPWTIEQGTLSISQNGSLGSAASTLTIDGGTLQTTDAFTLNRDIVLGSNGGRIQQTGGDNTVTGVISGDGKLTKEGNYDLVLTRDNTYTGGTEVISGRVVLGNGGTSGRILGDVALNGGNLAVNRSDDVVLDNLVSGTGSLGQIGSGTTIITADNTYTGRTYINNGTLQIGNGGTTGSIDNSSDVAIAANGTLAFNRSDDITFDREISGTGVVRQIGSNLVNLTGDSSAFNGGTFVESGTLAVNGALGGYLEVQSGANLIGTGTTGITLLQDGATVAPGNGSLGTLNVNGGFGQYAGSTYQAELDPTNGNDLIAVTGAAVLDEGAVLEINKLGNERHDLERRYTILTATEGVTGTYNLVGDTKVSAFYRLEDHYDANSVSIKVNEFRQFQEAAATPNQTAAATGAQSLKHIVDDTPGYEENGRPTNELYRAIAYLPDDQIAQYAFDQISGEIYGSTQAAMLEDSRFVREATSKRLRESLDGSKPADAASVIYDTAFWTHGYGSWSKTDGDGNAADFSRNIGGFFAGVDTAVAENIRIGLLGGYSRSTFKVDDRHSEAKSSNYDLGAYAGGLWNGFGINAGVNYTWHKVETDRTVAFADFYDTLNSDYKANTFQVYGDVSYKFHIEQSVIEPFAGLAYVKLDRDGYNELGGAAALHGSGEKIDTTFSTLGVRGSTSFDLSGVKLTAEGMLGWRHAFDGDLSDVTHAFTGGTDFTVSGVPVAKDVAVIEAGFSTAIDQNISLGVSYVGQFGSGKKENGLRGNLSVKF